MRFRSRLSLTLLATVLCALTDAAGAQRPLPVAGAAVPGASITGIVYDSIARAPLVDASVQLVNADSVANAPRTAVTDSLGRFRINNVHQGRYLLAFLHPMLDSLGLEPKPREVVVSGPAPIRSDMAIPSTLSLRLAICGAAVVADSDALIMGILRRASDRGAVDSAVVKAQWLNLVLASGGLNRTTVRKTATTGETGWFAICGAPRGGNVLLAASHGADSTETLELLIPATGFLRRDLYLGAARIAAADTVRAAGDSTRLAPRRVGDGRLTGTVVAVTGGRPLVGARVRILNGPTTRTNERGEWTLTGIPTGTRTLEVLALAHYPVSQPVDVIDGAPPLRIAMATVQSVLDTVRILGTRSGRVMAEFMQRRRSSGTGKFLTGEEIAARNPVYTADLFRGILGVYVDRDRNGDDVLTMRGNGMNRCQPTVFVNGMSLRGLSSNDINGIVKPNDIIGVEVYAAAGAPAQFQDYNGCGSLVFWTK